MPYEIEVLDSDTEKKADDKPNIINDTQPIWKKDPKSLTDEDYKTFYQKLFPFEAEPLFWIHLNVDHPFHLNGVLYFPKVNLFKNPVQEKNIKLYCRQVFVSENVKNVIPDFLSLLKGAIDSPDIPLNVSRSSLQGDPNVKKISNYVVKKVAESLKVLFNNDREKYEKIWDDIGLFVKYGCMSDEKFDELMRERVIFKSSNEKFQTLNEYLEAVPADYKAKLEKTILYYEKENYDHAILSQLKSENIFAVNVDDHIDPHFMQHVEYKKLGDKEYKFSGIQSEVANLLGGESTTKDDIKIKEFFEKMILSENDLKDKNKEVEVEKLKNASSPAYFKVDESMKRFAKMSVSMGNGMGSFPVKKTLVINPNNPLIQNAFKIFNSGKNEGLAKKLAHHVEDLANISSEGLKSEHREAFVKRSQDIISELSNLAL
jgi:molecular chaperone HtpG